VLAQRYSLYLKGDLLDLLRIMSINIIVERKYANGIKYYTDGDGNPIDYEEKYDPEVQYYIDTTAEERAEAEVRRLETQAYMRDYYSKRQQMFVVKNPPMTTYVSWQAPAPFPRGEGSCNQPALQAPLLKKEGCYTPSPLRGTPPTLGGEFARQPLWGSYWAERELCVVAGDTGVGKTLLALQVAKALAGGRVLGVEDNIGRPRKVLYLDFELDAEALYERFGVDDTLEHLYWAGYNKSGKRPSHLEDAGAWMLTTLKDCITEYSIDAIIIDQPDRLRLTPQKWDELLMRLKDITRIDKVAIMLIVNTKPRNFNRPLELSHIYNHRTLSFDADSIVAIGADYKHGAQRYIKPLKNKNRALWRNGDLEGFWIVEPGMDSPLEGEEDYTPSALCATPPTLGGEFDGDLNRTPPSAERGHPQTSLPPSGYSLQRETANSHPSLNPSPKVEGLERFILQIFLTAACPEEDYLRPSKTRLREQKMIAAESMRKDEMPIDDIAIELGVPEGTVKRWVAGIRGARGYKKTSLPPSGDSLTEGDRPRTAHDDRDISEGEELRNPSPSHSEGTPTDAAVSTNSFKKGDLLPRVLPVDWEYSVNNPDSPNYDPFAYNPYLIENEQREMGIR
jgi:hypothetical protein